MICAVERIIIITILFSNAVIPLILGGGDDCSEVQVCSQPALGTDLNSLVDLIIPDIRDRASAIDN